jgi:hypothetical protein
MPRQQRIEELSNRFKAEMQEYINEGFQANDCFPFVFQNLIETTGISGPDRAELQRELMEWTQKICDSPPETELSANSP